MFIYWISVRNLAFSRVLLLHGTLEFVCLLSQNFCSFRSLVFDEIPDGEAKVYGIPHHKCNIDHNDDFTHSFTNCLRTCPSPYLDYVVSSLCSSLTRCSYHIVNRSRSCLSRSLSTSLGCSFRTSLSHCLCTGHYRFCLHYTTNNTVVYTK